MQNEKLQKLVELEYFSLVPPANLESEKEKSEIWINDPNFYVNFDRYDTEKILGSTDLRIYGVDAESLSEGSLDKYFANMQDTFQALGIKIELQKEEIDSDYIVWVNNQKFVILYANESDLNIWWLASKRFINIIESELQKQNNPHRIYLYAPGNNDSVMLFLTPEQRDYIVDLGVEKPLSVQEIDEK